jgi:LmbE family N-acetylglucosaminyl deacetylase
VLTWAVHQGERWPRPRGLHPTLEMSPPPRLRRAQWLRFDLSAAEVERKELALESHATQMKVMRRFLQAFVRADEIFARGAAAQGSAPADAGLDEDRAD